MTKMNKDKLPAWMRTAHQQNWFIVLLFILVLASWITIRETFYKIRQVKKTYTELHRSNKALETKYLELNKHVMWVIGNIILDHDNDINRLKNVPLQETVDEEYFRLIYGELIEGISYDEKKEDQEVRDTN